jgi:NADH pyrophosphatase NudC (nudix superfamily)
VRDHDHEVDEARWFPMDQVIKTLKFATERKMVHRALNILSANENQRIKPVLEQQSENEPVEQKLPN